MTQRVDTECGFRLFRADSNTPTEVFARLENIDKAAVGAEGWSAESFLSEAQKENGIVLYIEHENHIIALLSGYHAVGEGDITSVAVIPEYRRLGLAARLIREFEQLLPETTENIFLEVRESNTPALELYRKCGFEKISVRKNFYAHPRENAIVMMKAEV